MTGVKFTCDGRRILAATNAKRMTVLDVDRAEQIQCFDNCAVNARDRIPLATDPVCPHLAVCVCVNGKGLTLFDLRMPLPLDFVLDLHSSPIRDISFLDNSWPFLRSHQSGLVSLSADGVCKVTTLDGRTLHCFEVGHASHCIAVTPESFGGVGRSSSISQSLGGLSCVGSAGTSVSSSSRFTTSRLSSLNSIPGSLGQKFASLMIIGGPCLSRYRPDTGLIERQEVLKGIKSNWEVDVNASASAANNLSVEGPSPPLTPTVVSCPSTPTNTPSSCSPHSSSPSLTSSAASHITRLKYTSNGSLLYASTNTGVVKRYRRYPDGQHKFLGDVMHHKGVIYDMDISPFDEYLITASKDRHVGLLCLGSPNHGWTGFCQLT